MAALNYHHLRYFWAVAHEGSLTGAAARLNVAQSSLSVQIKTLEERLGHALFERRGKHLVLTEAGRIALDHADAIFDLGDDLLATLAEAGTAQRSVFRVGAVSTLSRNFQLSFLRPLLDRVDVEVVIRSGRLGPLLQALEAHQLDVVLANTLPPRDAASPWLAHVIDDQPVSLIGTPGRVAGRADLAALVTDNALVAPTRDSSIRADFDALMDRLGLRPRLAAEVDDMAMLRLLARDDMGLAVLPPIVVQDELDSGALVEALRLPDLTESFYAITQRRRFPNPLLKALLPA
ncbi:LysR family transcriptional regulator [Rhodothalassium salexigens DSM 2132]|uniref:LysR family transcriptional regulator n=1 Tax=Rhodothalassium salexigens DSM 2132 TaxID=1188247 RepID=A0A4R2PKM1_RHOSA|nr:LysR family transcriptional regulator [Rhodothalassium salexigens]MBB4211223.1 LysR family transcriptional activator of nhaA [Rhodothalassium salexigens DSM 2132]MBK1637562.1 LysR family transcriptional regulator [Rhodothalassium salexigens DSM 2132]TCP36122.1 LysR family transcriptional regulator [Rhodothalassium salexigens DSM 2132]